MMYKYILNMFTFNELALCKADKEYEISQENQRDTFAWP